MNAARYLLENSAREDDLALLTLKGDVTHGEVRRQVCAVSAFLRDQGLAKGERVLLIAEPDLFWVSAYLGTILAGGVSVPLPPSVGEGQLSQILKMADPKWVFADGKSMQKYGSVFPASAEIVTSGPGKGRGAAAGPRSHLFTQILECGQASLKSATREVDPARDLAALMFTSGSTGEPRGVMVSHRNIQANTESIIEYLRLTRNDRIMAVLPFYYCFGTSLLHTHLKVGGSIVVDNRFVFPEMIIQRMISAGCTGLAGVPSTFQILLRKSRMKFMEFPDLRYVQQAGGKLPNLFIDELRKALPTTEVFVMYGQTEATARLSYLPPTELERKLGSIGKGIPGVKLQVLKDDGCPVSPGEVGEIVAEGDNIAMGYWNRPEETARSFRDGRLHTGDLATVDEDGYIFVVDRAKDILKCGGYRASSKEIEDVILKYPNMIEVAVISQPDDVLGESVRLYLVHPDGEKIRQGLETFCGQNLEWSFIPRAYVFLDELPKNASGKVDKTQLKTRMRSESEGQ